MNKSILKYLLPCVAFAAVITLASSFNLGQEEINFTVPQGWPRPTYDFSKNKPTSAGFKLGRMLFYDPALSRDGSRSCASCHMQSSGFTESERDSNESTHALQGTRSALSLVNLAWNTSFMWDGGVNHLEVQPLAPITSPSEMNNTLANVVKTLSTSTTYRRHFYLAFGDSIITGQHVLKALSQFTVMFESYNSRYDKYVRHEPGGDMNTQELHGLTLFRAHCESCHTEPLFTNQSFQNTGLATNNPFNDIGRMKITGDPNDSLKFKVPTLRNIAVSYPYMHDGQFKTLMQVLDHYTDGVIQSRGLAKELRQQIQLSATDKNDIIAFLQTLTDRTFLDDPRFSMSENRKASKAQ